MWPTLWALLMANNGFPSLKLIIIFVLGIFLMRSAGCIFNDISDKDFDGQVERTKFRPLVTGEISIKQAVTVAVIMVLICFLLVLQLNLNTVILSFIALALAVIYPLCKRFFSMPQIVLGLAFNFGVIMAYSASTNAVFGVSWLVYIAAIIWTIAYDTIYALSDLKYDSKAKLHSSAIFFGKMVIPLIIIFQILFLFLLILTGYVMRYDFIYYISLLCCIPFFTYQYYLYRSGGIIKCITAFSNNHWIGLVIFLGIFLQYY